MRSRTRRNTRRARAIRRLKPTTADQLDLTYEWYFSSTGSLTTALFYKKFNDYVQYGNYTRDFTNNGVTRNGVDQRSDHRRRRQAEGHRSGLPAVLRCAA